MFRRLLATVLTVTALAACSSSNQDATPETPDAPAATAAATPAADTVAPAASASVAPASPSSVAAAAPSATPAAPVVDPNAPAPRLGTDYEVLPTPQPTWGPADGKVEVTEVFSYMCHVCAEVQPSVDLYKPTLPADARWVYVPATFGGAWDVAARAFFTAQAMGVAERAHSQMFPAIFVENRIKKGEPGEFADFYAGFGADRAVFLSTMSSFGVTAKFNRAKQFALRAGVTGTPTFIVNGKYKVMNTRDRGIQGVFETVNFLIAQERAAVQPAATP
jgi:thiol:disulfide interchange protein DsbA